MWVFCISVILLFLFVFAFLLLQINEPTAKIPNQKKQSMKLKGIYSKLYILVSESKNSTMTQWNILDFYAHLICECDSCHTNGFLAWLKNCEV